MPRAALAAIIGTFGVPIVIVMVLLVVRWLDARHHQRTGQPGSLSRHGFVIAGVVALLLVSIYLVYALLHGGVDFS